MAVQLKRFSDLGLRVVMQLSEECLDGSNRRSTIQNLADDISAPPAHVAKIVSRLVDMGVLRSVRGCKGGVYLVGGALTRTVGDVLRELEGAGAVINCFEPTRCPYVSRDCYLRYRLAAAKEAFFASLDDLSLADLLPDTTANKNTVVSTDAGFAAR